MESIEHLAWLLFLRVLDTQEEIWQTEAELAGKPYESILEGELARRASIPQPDAAFAPLELSLAISVTNVITYTYDPLNRLTAADYDNGVYFHYTYDPVGNRLTQTSSLNQGNPDVYVYDSANRLTSVNGQSYTWDNNGSLLDDGVYSYVYDRANRLVEMREEGISATYAYNGLGERMQQTVDVQTTDFIVDQAGGLTQVLSDGMDSYLYGLRRIAEQDAEGWQYYMGDALGSVRQWVEENGEVRLAKEYEPYGGLLSSAGEVESRYGFTEEWIEKAILWDSMQGADSQ